MANKTNANNLPKASGSIIERERERERVNHAPITLSLEKSKNTIL
jgi:hypothetical protein